MTTPTHELPSVFDAKGKFAPLTKEQIEHLSPAETGCYTAVAEMATLCELAEENLRETTARLHQAVRDLRSVEQRLHALPPVDQLAETRHALMDAAARRS